VARPTETEIAWAAGLFEGEGCMSLSGGPQQYGKQPTVQIAITDRDVLERFVTIVERGGVRVYKPDGKRKTVFQWSVKRREDVLYVLGLLWPYMGERRREKADEVIERAAQRMSLAQKKGWCLRGHELVGENLYVHKKTGKRHCQRCRRERRRVSRRSA
jgi:hypothetical protein